MNLRPEQRVLGLHGLVVDADAFALRRPCRRSGAWRSSGGRARPGGRWRTGRSRPAPPLSPRCRPSPVPKPLAELAPRFRGHERHSVVGDTVSPSHDVRPMRIDSCAGAAPPVPWLHARLRSPIDPTARLTRQSFGLVRGRSDVASLSLRATPLPLLPRIRRDRSTAAATRTVPARPPAD